MRLPWQREEKNISLETLLQNLEAAYTTTSGIAVTPDSSLNSPTVHAIVTAVSRRISVSPCHVYRTEEVNGRRRTTIEENHPVSLLLRAPNQWQTEVEFWLDSVSSFMRWGRFHAYKARASDGTTANLIPVHAGNVTVEQMDSRRLMFEVQLENGRTERWDQPRMLYVRGAGTDFFRPVSPVMAVRESIALELAAEQFGAAFFSNGALPLLLFELQQGFNAWKTEGERDEFLAKLKEKFTSGKRFSSMILPKGMTVDTVNVENDKAQFIETRRLIRNVIAGAFGVPPHLVGDLERATFNNVEQQDRDFSLNVVMPVARAFEEAMTRDLLNREDRRNGYRVRFDLDSIKRADFKTRQEGYRLLREWGIISPNDWREAEMMNPIPEDQGGEDYIHPMNMVVQGKEDEQSVSDEDISGDSQGDESDGDD